MCKPLKDLFESSLGAPCEAIVSIEPHASDRKIYRLTGGGKTAIGVYNRNRRENLAFLSFSRHFHKHGLRVPTIYAENADECVYLEEDFGDTTLMAHLNAVRTEADPFPAEIENLYRDALSNLVQFQVVAGESANFTVCCAGSHFGRTGMLYDLEQFDKWFLSGTGIKFDEAALKRDLSELVEFLAQAESGFFLYRDFQARNIMVKAGQLCFIDYQGGRKGPLQWDVASLLYQSSARVPAEARVRLLDYYLDVLEKHISVDRNKFREYYAGFALIRLLQAMGTYGRAGLHEGKEYFLNSIEPAVQNIKGLVEEQVHPGRLPVLSKVLNEVILKYT